MNPLILVTARKLFRDGLPEDGALLFDVADKMLETLHSFPDFCEFIIKNDAEQAPVFLANLLKIMSLSPFVCRALQMDDSLLACLWGSGFVEGRSESFYLNALKEAVKSAVDEPGLFRQLRCFRRQEMVRIVWRDLLNYSDLSETMANVSALADASIQVALNWLYKAACEKWGIPAGAIENEAPLVVLGMGKLGASELNVSSDIDLIFSYPCSGKTNGGETSGGKRSLDNQTFFIRLGQRLIASLDEVTADGFVFRVDMRLRPYGQSGALALSFSAMEEYYQTQGREWERYAMIKARPITGTIASRQSIQSLLTPFVYRKYTDFSVVESLREMKGMIESEIHRKGMDHNVKLGSGGIREIEFIVQAFQLIYGGKNAALRVPELKQAFLETVDADLLPKDVVDELLSSYDYLRNVEHCIQGMDDKQTQLLPSDELSCLRLSFVMGEVNWTGFCAKLDTVRQRVKYHFDQFIQPEAISDESSLQVGNKSSVHSWQDFWQRIQSSAVQQENLSQFSEKEKELADEALKVAKHPVVRKMSAEGRMRLDIFMPQLLCLVQETTHPEMYLASVIPIVLSVLRRSAYLVLLYENIEAFRHFIRLCAASSWVARTLAQTPLLLDEFLNRETLYSPPNAGELAQELRVHLLSVPEDDEERQLEVLRLFKKSHVLRVAASEIRGTLPTMKVSDYLSWIAETVVTQTMEIAWNQLTRKYGVPVYKDGTTDPEPLSKFAVIAYGKLGGIELSYGSDLDMVFLAEDDISGGTNGNKTLDNAIFYARLGQRIIHILSANTVSGQLYEADMRLRPSGHSGLLVTTVSAYEKYQKHSAWTWEKQALVRARWIAGSEHLKVKFDSIRYQVLTSARNEQILREEIVNMRNKMYQTYKLKMEKGSESFHLKQALGGLIDIEFIAQFAVLSKAGNNDDITLWSDNMRIFDAMATSGLWSRKQCSTLQQAYLLFRAKGHACILQQKRDVVPLAEVKSYVLAVNAIWASIMEEPREVGRDCK